MRGAPLGSVLLIGGVVLAACGAAPSIGSVAGREAAVSEVPVPTAAPSADDTLPGAELPVDDPLTTVPRDDSAEENPETPRTTAIDVTVLDAYGRRFPELGGLDELFPELGSPDVDVVSYDVRLDLRSLGGGGDPGRRDDSPAEVEIVADVPLDVGWLALDAVGIDVREATIDGESADIEVVGNDLAIVLPEDRSRRVTAVIGYETPLAEVPSASGLPLGWFSAGDDAHAFNQPDGARTWLPSNDHPSDKAAWRFEVLAPADAVVSANGDLLQEGSSSEPWIWEETDPMATYLIHLVVGDFEFVDDEITTVAGDLGLVHLVPSGETGTYTPVFDSIDPQIDFLETVFGAYPLDRYGVAIAGLIPGLAMETQGRTLLDRDFGPFERGGFEEIVLSHELAHQWFGNAVTPAEWSDVWLSESFATYGQWLWFDAEGLRDLESSAGSALANRQLGAPPTGDPTAESMFGFNSYDGGAAVVHALRLTMGDASFFNLLQRWVGEYTGTSQTTEAFIAMASDVHGSDLAGFFDEWLYAGTVPSDYPS